MKVSTRITFSFILIFSLINLLGYSQSNIQLEKKNGFQNLKLGSDIRNYSGFMSIEDFMKTSYYSEYLKIPSSDLNNLPSFPISEYDFIYGGDEYRSIGNARIKWIFIKTLNNKISSIEITAEYDISIMETLESLYGNSCDFLTGECNKKYFTGERKTPSGGFVSCGRWLGKNIDLSVIGNREPQLASIMDGGKPIGKMTIIYISKSIELARKKQIQERSISPYKKDF